jgi:hypothetical protein
MRFLRLRVHHYEWLYSQIQAADYLSSTWHASHQFGANTENLVSLLLVKANQYWRLLLARADLRNWELYYVQLDNFVMAIQALWSTCRRAVAVRLNREYREQAIAIRNKS